MYIIDQNSKKPLFVQLYEELKKDIVENYETGQKIPSIRKICSTYNLSKNTVENAYSQLVVEGYIESIPKSAYVVTHSLYSDFNSKNIDKIKTEDIEEYKYEFSIARLEKDSFPLKLWKRLFTKAVDESIDFGKYQNGQGEFGLRVQIADYLTKSRGVNCNANQIVVCNGFADSMGLVARIFKDSDKTFAIESPGYYIASDVFSSYNYEVLDIPILEDGIDLKALKTSNSKLVYITPSHQYPTGIALPITKRMELLKWAKDVNGYIIEDDYDSELNYENRPIPSLQGLDKNDRVIYVGTFSKSLSPMIRVSYMVLPNSLLKTYKSFYDLRTPRVCITTQKVLEKFIQEGHWDSHLRKIRTLNKKKHNLMKKLLKQKLGNTLKIESCGAGLAIHINPKVPFDWEKFELLAIKEKIKVYYAKDKTNGKWQAMMMGFGGFKEEQIEEAINAFTSIWNKSII